MCRVSYCQKYNPKCFFCQCPIPRVGEICQSCRYTHNLKEDICICDENSPGECQSKLDHYCCCTYVFNPNRCQAENIMHDCICNINSTQCRAEIHDNSPDINYDDMRHSDSFREEYSSQFNVDISDMENEEEESQEDVRFGDIRFRNIRFRNDRGEQNNGIEDTCDIEDMVPAKRRRC
mgnify:CR=1 FL=1